ncbi:MAG: glycosyltransferase family 4 protein [Candidatus Auribacterota bacterium]
MKNTIENDTEILSGKRRRIAFVTSEFFKEYNTGEQIDLFDGGVAVCIYRLCLSLKQKGYEPIVITASKRNGIVFYNTVEVHRVVVPDKLFCLLNKLTLSKFRNTLFWLWQSFKLNRVVRNIHKKKNISLIEYSSLMAIGLLSPKNIPSTVRIYCHQKLLMEANEEFLGYDGSIMMRLERLANKRARAISCPSRILKKYVENEIGKDVHLISNFFCADQHYANVDERPYADLLHGKKYLLYFGALCHLKGLPEIAEIIYPLLDKHPSLYFVLAGRNMNYYDRQMTDYIWEKAGRHRGRVIYMGILRHDQLYPVLKNAYVVVLPSRIDNIPNTCIEAMMCKRVVIGTNGSSLEELIDDGVTGFLSELRNPPSLLCAVEKMLGMPHKEIREMGEKACRNISALTHSNTSVQQFIKFYEDVISN